jgi:hypothetical protein
MIGMVSELKKVAVSKKYRHVDFRELSIHSPYQKISVQFPL